MQLPVRPPSQQPVAQEVGSQTQAALTQRFPEPQAGPVPQAHAPAVQRSATDELHALHEPPAVPHSESVGGVVQLPLWQQPFAHELESHVQTPAAQRWPEAQGAVPPHLH